MQIPTPDTIYYLQIATAFILAAALILNVKRLLAEHRLLARQNIYQWAAFGLSIFIPAALYAALAAPQTPREYAGLFVRGAATIFILGGLIVVTYFARQLINLISRLSKEIDTDGDELQH